MADPTLATAKAVADEVFQELEQEGFVLEIETDDGTKTPTKDLINALAQAILKNLKEKVTVDIKGTITCPPNGGPATHALVGTLKVE